MASEENIRAMLMRLVDGLTGLRDEGKFSEPNLDGSDGDYISFNAWEWPQGVGLYGLTRLWLATEDAKLKALLENWYDHHCQSGLPALNINTTAPMLALSILWDKTREPRWQAILQDWAERLTTNAPRTNEGGFQHDVSDKINNGELWDDTLFMSALFLASYGQTSEQRHFVDEAELQFLVHSRYLADPQTGLWFHGWSFERMDNFARARWARGNAWITAGLADLPEVCRLNPAIARYLDGILQAQITALLPLQTHDGAWRTLLDDPTSYPETSATAGIAYGLMKAARLGRASEAARQSGLKAVDYVLSQIGQDGVVGGVSYGTRMGHDLQFYRDIPIQPTGYGQALAILCLSEALHHGDCR